MLEREVSKELQLMCEEEGWSKNFSLKLLVYVDDYLLAVTHDHHFNLCVRAGVVIDRILDEMAIENARHKAIGPVDCLVWLGLLIDCRAGRVPSVRLPEDKRRSYLCELLRFHDDFGGASHVPARRMAEVLGRLNLAANGYVGGEFFMARMWDRFRGLIVDWSKGAIRLAAGVRNVPTDEEMWWDAEWWVRNLSSIAGKSLVSDLEHRWMVRGGMDGSDGGSGQFVVIHSEREEIQYLWTKGELRKPINWRELNGVLRLIRNWGPRICAGNWRPCFVTDVGALQRY